MIDIHTATERGRTARVKEILAADPGIVNLRNKLNDQPLHLAAHHGRVALVEILLNAGAAIDSKGDSGRTPLHFAVLSQHPKVLLLLLRHGANANVEDDFGSTPLYLAASVKEPNAVEALMSSGAKLDPRAAIYLEGPAAVIGRLEADPIPLGPKLAQLLLLDAIRLGATGAVSYLLQHGADARKPCFGETPPLLEAVSMRDTSIVRALLEAGADIQVRDHVGRPILKFCSVYGAPQ
jgi:ankyrin repeat protein